MSLWMKLYVDILGDPKLMRASRSGRKSMEFLPWLLIFAKRANDQGRLTVNAMPAEIEDIARDIPSDIRHAKRGVRECIHSLAEIGVLAKDADGVYRFTRWQGRQHVKPSDAPERVTSRVRAYRDRQRGNDNGNTPVTPNETPDVTPQSKSESKSKSESESVTPAPVTSTADEPAPRVAALPAKATAFLAMFYEPALTEQARDRYRNVKAQLYDVLDPQHPGVKIRGGARVKARDVPHLDHVLDRVMKDPPMDRDLAIVFVLKKLTDPPPGPSPTEVAEREDHERRQLEERYARQRRLGVTRWALEHPEEHERFKREVETLFPASHSFGNFGDIARQAEIDRRCQVAGAFESFDDWLANQRRPAAAASP